MLQILQFLLPSRVLQTLLKPVTRLFLGFVAIPLFRLVQFQLERDGRETDALLDTLQQRRVLSAVYRVSPPKGAQPQGLALRLMVDPRRNVMPEQTRATA